MWFSKMKLPPSTVTDEDMQELKNKTDEITATVNRMERTVMDGESMWMLVKCPVAQVPMCVDNHPKQERLKQCTQT